MVGGKCAQVANRQVLTKLNQVWGKLYVGPLSTFAKLNQGWGKVYSSHPFDRAPPSLGESTQVARRELLTETRLSWGESVLTNTIELVEPSLGKSVLKLPVNNF